MHGCSACLSGGGQAVSNHQGAVANGQHVAGANHPAAQGHKEHSRGMRGMQRHAWCFDGCTQSRDRQQTCHGRCSGDTAGTAGLPEEGVHCQLGRALTRLVLGLRQSEEGFAARFSSHQVTARTCCLRVRFCASSAQGTLLPTCSGICAASCCTSGRGALPALPAVEVVQREQSLASDALRFGLQGSHPSSPHVKPAGSCQALTHSHTQQKQSCCFLLATHIRTAHT